jgi:hypothetical protein
MKDVPRLGLAFVVASVLPALAIVVPYASGSYGIGHSGIRNLRPHQVIGTAKRWCRQ